MLPLPAGEGWGEGELSKNPDLGLMVRGHKTVNAFCEPVLVVQQRRFELTGSRAMADDKCSIRNAQ